ncbi:NAD(P)-binding protein [Aulographum hederae CBS 113979]|uniref:NAD(P)-binding protein n=1 Tax=Aulographum hederae CBS 113979 TaxID=1176131 RepID=A0A6G1GV34_9PEZI|nr:NAD(P)-binding protein [Aulographum hederae CBS 113979]
MPSPSAPKTWLITGCSSGFGRHLVHALLTTTDDKVIATARRIEDLDYIRSIPGGEGRAVAVRLDVTEGFEGVRGAIDGAVRSGSGEGEGGRVDVLVNNAGFVVSGVWEEVSHEETTRQLETNFFGAMKVTRAVLPYMRKARSGVILFMGSISGWHGVGAGGPYSASKFALEGAAKCLAKETAHLNIRTHILVLGQFRTAILSSDKKAGPLTLSTSPSAPASAIPDYNAVKAEMAERHRETHGKQPGDPAKAALRVIDVARLEDLGEGREGRLPFRIPLGTDAVGVMRMKCEETLEMLWRLEGFAGVTGFEGEDGGVVPSYYR